MRVSAAIVTVAAGLLQAGVVAQQQWPTLRQELQKHRVTAEDVPDADRRITSYAMSATEEWAGIAYYWHTGSDRLPNELRISTLDRKTGSWRSTIVPAEARNGGAVDRIRRESGFVYLDLHVNPSAGEIIVLNDRLDVKGQLAGLSGPVLSDGRLVYQNNMVHFAPAHPASVSLFDPRSGEDVRLYPAKAEPFKRPRWIDRSIRNIEAISENRLRMSVREQDVVVEHDRGRPDGPPREFSVQCDLSTRKPTCAPTSR